MENPELTKKISIPQWSDSKIFESVQSVSPSSISIPQWSDSKMSRLLIVVFRSVFQSHNGLILSKRIERHEKRRQPRNFNPTMV